MPPPISTLRSNFPIISLIISRFTVSPVKAPSKSTMCKFFIGCFFYFLACWTGDISYSVLLSKSPLTNLTHFLSLMSIAGIFLFFNALNL